MSESFDEVERFRVPIDQQLFPLEMATPNTLKVGRTKRINGEFLKGPIPLRWLSAASKLPGKAPLSVALAIQFEVGRRRKKEVVLTTKILERFGVDRKAKYRGLKSLANAGLIAVKQEPRRNPVVTILDVKANGTDGQSGVESTSPPASSAA